MKDIILTEQQQKGLEIAVARYYANYRYTCIAGYAGTGKSELVKFIIKALQIPPQLVCYIAYTGKAALVLREKGNLNAITAHKLLYKSYQKEDGSYSFYPRDKFQHYYKVVVVDEVSMLPKDMWDLLLSHPVYVIALGDPAQLPSIYKDNDVLQHPHVFLSEIMRQAKDSEIISLTMDIRAGKIPMLQKGKEVQVVKKVDLSSGMLLWADQVIVATNEKRNELNNLLRQYRWGNNVSKAPKEGDRLICLKNNWDVSNKLGDNLVNGTIGTIWNIRKRKIPITGEVYIADFLPCDRENSTETLDPYFRDLVIDKYMLEDGVSHYTPAQKKRMPVIPMPFSYGYAITCHKAQGSQWDKVLVIEENFPRAKEDHQRWLYTACTRPCEKLVIVKK